MTKKLTASLHHPNGDVMECITAMDYENVQTFLARIGKRWVTHIEGTCRVVLGSVGHDETV